jgi:hypothetical protein
VLLCRCSRDAALGRDGQGLVFGDSRMIQMKTETETDPGCDTANAFETAPYSNSDSDGDIESYSHSHSYRRRERHNRGRE